MVFVRRLMRRLGIVAFLIVASASSLFGANVRNEVAKQVGTKVLFEFDVISKEKEAVVSFELTLRGKKYTSGKLSLKGDIGKVQAGKRKKIYWDVLKDFPKGFSGEVTWNISAKDIKKSVDKMVFVKGGCFEMGDAFDGTFTDDKPAHEICVDGYHIARHEVTVGEFRKFVKSTGYKTDAERGGGCFYLSGGNWEISKKIQWRNPGFKISDRQPVSCVSWNDSLAFVTWLSRSTNKKYRLPSEAEWEYAARSRGMKEKWADTNKVSDLKEYAWYGKNSGNKAHDVGQKKPNRVGLFDMSGNVWEWVADKYDEDYYKNSQKKNPSGPGTGMFNVLRGGSWVDNPEEIHVTRRMKSVPKFSSANFGFRYVMTK